MKKKFLSIPAILLLLLLFVFHGITYADTCRTWTEEELKNVIYNYYTTYRNFDETTINNFFETNQTNIQTLLNKLNSSSKIIISGIDSYGLAFQFPVANDPGYYIAANRLIINSRAQGDIAYILGWNTLTMYTKTNLADLTSYTFTENFLYTTINIKQNNTVKYGPGYYTPSNIFDGPYNQMLFMFTPEQTDTKVDVDIFEDIPAYEYSVGENIIIGILYVPNETEITNFSLIRAYYTGDYWKYIEVTTEYPNSYIYYNQWTEEEDFKSYEVIFNRQYIQQNNIYIITWSDQTEEPYQNATGTFYIKNGQTVIVNGEVIPSGDNITGAIGELQEDINNNNDFWKETYDKLFTIDSGDAEEIINNFLESSNLGEYGLESGEIAILNVLNGEPSDFIISWNSVIIPNLKDNTPTQLVPAGNINFSKVSVTLGNESYTLSEERLNQFMIIIGWVQLIMGISVVILTIANVWETLMRALGVGVGLYEDNADEHSTIVNVGEDGSMRTTEVVRTPTKSRIWYIHKKY